MPLIPSCPVADAADSPNLFKLRAGKLGDRADDESYDIIGRSFEQVGAKLPAQIDGTGIPPRHLGDEFLLTGIYASLHYLADQGPLRTLGNDREKTDRIPYFQLWEPFRYYPKH